MSEDKVKWEDKTRGQKTGYVAAAVLGILGGIALLWLGGLFANWWFEFLPNTLVYILSYPFTSH